MLESYTTVQLGTLAFAGASALLGLFIAFHAYRGLRRYGSRQMLFLAVGMILLFGVAYGVAIVGSMLIALRQLPLPWQDHVRLLVRVVQFVGLACIAYSLRLGGEPAP